MNTPEEDIKQLSLLATFHYVLGGIIGFFSCLPLIHVVIGILIATLGTLGQNVVAPIIGWMFIITGSFPVALGWTMAIFMFIVARNLNRKTNYRFCFVVSCIECVFIPFGTILGVFTILALNKDSVKAAFDINPTSN